MTKIVRNLVAVLVDVFGFKIRDIIAIDKRMRQVTAVSVIGIVFASFFALFNLFTPNMQLLGKVELAAIGILLIAAFVGRNPNFVAFAEDLVMLATLCIVGALIVFGGIEGTGLYWVYTAPFLAFFLKGQRLGWWYSVALVCMVATYFISPVKSLSIFYPHSSIVATHFTLSLAFYTLVAAAFNHLRTRFEEQLQKQVTIKTADSQKLLEQLQFIATHDQLTQLPNKVRLEDIIKKQIDDINPTEQILVVCILKLERMFEMGNILGSSGADNLVLKIAENLKQFIDFKGALAHIYRDEFVISYPAERDSLNVQGIQHFFSERQISIEIQGYFIYCEITMGLALYPDHATDPQILLNKAQQAMLQAHKNGQQWLIYNPIQEKAFVRHHLLFGKLRAALMQQHLQVHYQPQINLLTGSVIGAEALLRWHDPVEGYISPLEFIPVAEESGLIRPLTTWLVDVCMHDCLDLKSRGFDLHISINLSARNLLDPDLIPVLVASLEKYQLPASTITLEITESCFMSSPERALEVIQRLHDLGFRLSIDDFGTGYSSLSYLKNLPVNELKIDKAFVRHLLQNSGDQAIVSSTIDLAHNFGLKLVAEGIEDESTGDWLEARGCDMGQGYFFAKPMPADVLLKFLASRSVEKNTETNETNPSGDSQIKQNLIQP